MSATSPRRAITIPSPRLLGLWGVAWVITLQVWINSPLVAQPNPTGLKVDSKTQTTAALSWNQANNVDGYNVEVLSGSSVVFSGSTVDPTTSIEATGLTPATTYSWRVKSVKGNNTSSGANGPSFTTESDTSPPPLAPPPTPGGLTTTNITATGATLQWNASTGAVSYDIQVSGPGNPSYSSNTTGTSVNVTGLTSGSTYNWEVSAKNAAGSSSAASASFSTPLAPPSGTPTIVSPSPGAQNVSTSPTMSWSAVQGAQTYTVQVTDKNNFNSPEVSISGITGTSTGVANLSGEKTYNWRVRGENSAGEGPWATASFKTASTRPVAPTLVSPSNRAASVSINTTLLWASVPNATEYEVSVAENSTFTTVVGGGTTTRAQFDLSGLAYDKTYFWRVRSTTVGGVSDWSSTWEFKTESGRPVAPALVSPSNNARDVSVNSTLEWANVTGSLSYSVQVATDNNFIQKVAEAEGLTSRSYALSGLSGNTTYRWRVRGHGPNGAGDWSVVWSFTTGTALPVAPTLSLPLDKAANLAMNVTLSWMSANGAATYNLQVSTDRNFRTAEFNQTGITVTSYEVTGLAANTTYYWHVSATNAAGTGAWSGDRSFTTGSGMPAAPALVAPSNNSTGISTNPSFSWQPLSGVLSYTIQIASDRQFRTIVAEQSGLISASYSLTGLNPLETYWWRISAVNAIGQGLWSSEWSFTTGTGALGAPSLISPSNGANGVSTNPVLAWAASAGAASYGVQYGPDRNFRKDVVEISGLTMPMVTLEDLTPNQTYYWRVIARDSSRESSWSSDFSFTTGTGKLGAPLLVGPANNATGVSLVPTFSWAEVPGALSYGIQIASDRNFRTIIAEGSDLDRPSYQAPLLTAKSSYYWRVNASDSAGTSSWSAEWMFTTGSSQLAAPQLIAPSNDAKGVSIVPTLSWGAIPGAQRYSVQVASDRNFRTIVFEGAEIREPTVKLPTLAKNETFYWRVASVDSIAASDWSTEWSFTTGSGVLAAPIIISPSDGSAGVSTHPTLVWSPVAGASAYHLQLSSDRQFRTIVQDLIGIKETSAGLSSLTPKSDYYWRVRGTDSTGGLSDWSLEWTFTTGSGRLGSPALLFPSDAATGISTVPIISWSPTPGAVTYTLQLATNQNFNKDLVEASGLTRSSFTPSELATNQKYFWRVQARDTASASDWSAVWSFTTGTGKLSTPALLAPPDGGSAPLNATLTWNPSANATSYAIQVATDRNFRNLIVDNSNLQATSLTVTGLSERERYYWRVRANALQEQSDWSGEWVFTASSTATSVEPVETGLPEEFVIFQNYPNPFNPTTTIRFSLPKKSTVRIVVYNLLGAAITTLVDQQLHAGSYETRWDASSMPSGVYFYRLEAEEFVATRRLVLLK